MMSVVLVQLVKVLFRIVDERCNPHVGLIGRAKHSGRRKNRYCFYER